ncbi:MAG: hypothetical protein FD149_805 [Rhodospirillaceae bacterium]|nr:MAG: hypothetical protein FD149_805 [Rhodospirillaceae bacterium]
MDGNASPNNGDKTMKTHPSTGITAPRLPPHGGQRRMAILAVVLALLPDGANANPRKEAVVLTTTPPQTVGARASAAVPKPKALSLLVTEALSRLLAPHEDNAGDPLRQFYRSHRYQPLWIGEEGPSARAKILVEALKTAEGEGLPPHGYGLSGLEHGLKVHGAPEALAKREAPETLAKLEGALTAAFVRYAEDLRYGRVRARDVEPGLFPEPPPLDVGRLLRDVARTQDFSRFLAEWAPPAVGYRKLRDALRYYRALAAAGGWPVVPGGPTLRPGMVDPRVAVLRQRLRVNGELPPDTVTSDPVSNTPNPVSKKSDSPMKGTEDTPETMPVHFTSAVAEAVPGEEGFAGGRLAHQGRTFSPDEVFDPVVEEAVRRFQRRHGLEADGTMGARTLATLNVPVEARIRQIILTMERWRWVPTHLGRRYVMVNIPAAFLEVWEEGQVVLAMRVVVGQPKRQTPIFKATLTHLILNPLWNVPHRLAVEDVAEKARKDPHYMTKQGIRIFTTIDDASVELDPVAVDWERVGKNRFPYRLRQDAGPRNAMGKMKFLMPNGENIYLHDTPMRHLFQRASRAESSGCIRLEKPVDLAAYLLGSQNGWSREKIKAITIENKMETIPVNKPMHVYLIYRTTWVDDNGTIEFRSDLYGRDSLLAKALFGAS